MGVKPNIRQVDSGTFFGAINSRTFRAYAITRARPTCCLRRSSSVQPPVALLTIPVSERRNPVGQCRDHRDGSAQTKQVYSQLSDLLLDEAFFTALASASPRMLLRSEFRGLGFTMHEGFNWSGVWKST